MAFLDDKIPQNHIIFYLFDFNIPYLLFKFKIFMKIFVRKIINFFVKFFLPKLPEYLPCNFSSSAQNNLVNKQKNLQA